MARNGTVKRQPGNRPLSPPAGDMGNNPPPPIYHPRPPEKRWGNRVLNNRERVASFPLEVIAGGLALEYGLPDALKSLREAAYHFRHATNTVSDAIQGGPEGMRAATNLEKAIETVEQAASTNKEAAAALEDYLVARKDFSENLLEIYQANETISRISDRLITQLKGTAKNFFEVGNALKSEWWEENIDGPIIVTYGKALRTLGNKKYKDLSDDQIIAKALESSENLKEFYKSARQFYDAREKNEDTIQQFCDYLAQTQQTTKEQNVKIEEQFPSLISRLKEGYEVEDGIFKTDKEGANMSPEDVTQTGQEVEGYRTNVDNTRASVEQAVPIPKYSELNWVDYATNPFVLAAIGVLVLRGAAVSLLPKGFKVDNAISKGVCYPFKLAGNLASNLYDRVLYHTNKTPNK